LLHFADYLLSSVLKSLNADFTSKGTFSLSVFDVAAMFNITTGKRKQ